MDILSGGGVEVVLRATGTFSMRNFLVLVYTKNVIPTSSVYLFY